MIDLKAIKARCEVAMKGPWSVGEYGIGEWEVIPVARGQDWGVFADRADAEFIAHARKDIPELVAEVERLRALILDAGMLDWLVKAAVRWWKDNGGEGTQKDIAAGYALVERLYAEENLGWRVDVLSNDYVAYRARVEELKKQLEREKSGEEG